MACSPSLTCCGAEAHEPALLGGLGGGLGARDQPGRRTPPTPRRSPWPRRAPGPPGAPASTWVPAAPSGLGLVALERVAGAPGPWPAPRAPPRRAAVRGWAGWWRTSSSPSSPCWPRSGRPGRPARSPARRRTAPARSGSSPPRRSHSWWSRSAFLSTGAAHDARVPGSPRSEHAVGGRPAPPHPCRVRSGGPGRATLAPGPVRPDGPGEDRCVGGWRTPGRPSCSRSCSTSRSTPSSTRACTPGWAWRPPTATASASAGTAWPTRPPSPALRGRGTRSCSVASVRPGAT